MKHIRTDGREAAIKSAVASRLPHPNNIRYKLDLGRGGNLRPSSFGIENKFFWHNNDLPKYLGINPEDKHGFIASISIRRCRFRKGLAEQRFIHCTFAIELHLVETCVAQGFDLHFPRHLDLAMFAVDRRFASLDLEDVLTPTGCVRGCDAVFLFVELKCGAKFAYVPE